MFRCASALGVQVPMCCLIDYRGYRLVAQSIVPISDATLIYGT